MTQETVDMEDQADRKPNMPEAQGPHDAPQLDARGAARRRFTRAGVGAAGVILTLHSQVGMAADELLPCASPSGFMSIKTASHNPQNSCTNNRSHGYWKTHSSAWMSSTGTSPDTRFGDVLAARGNYAGLADYTLMQVLARPKEASEIKDIDRNNVAMQIVTALLNARSSARSGIPSVLPEDKVVAMWDEFTLTNGYKPTGSATPWTGAQIAGYLETTFR